MKLLTHPIKNERHHLGTGTTNRCAGKRAQSAGSAQRSLDADLQSHAPDPPERTAGNGQQAADIVLRHNRRTHGQKQLGRRDARNGARRNGRDLGRTALRIYSAAPPQPLLSCDSIADICAMERSLISGGLFVLEARTLAGLIKQIWPHQFEGLTACFGYSMSPPFRDRCRLNFEHFCNSRCSTKLINNF